MREIKVRGWHRPSQSWHYFTLMQLTRIDTAGFWVDGIWRHVRFIDYENWCEYIGLKDKNKKEIYEGHILKVGDPDARPWIEPVIFWQGMFCIQPQKDQHPIPLDTYCNEVFNNLVEIIGNIYENPELLSESSSRKPESGEG